MLRTGIILAIVLLIFPCGCTQGRYLFHEQGNSDETFPSALTVSFAVNHLGKPCILFKGQTDSLVLKRPVPAPVFPMADSLFIPTWDPEEILFLDHRRDEIAAIVSHCFPVNLQAELANKGAHLESHILVDSIGVPRECAHFLTESVLDNSQSVLPAVECLDVSIKQTLCYEDNGRLSDNGLPYGITRIHFVFTNEGIIVKARHSIHDPEIRLDTWKVLRHGRKI